MMCSFSRRSGKRFSVFGGHGVEELKGARGMSRMVDFNARSWEGLGRSWHSFSLIFSLSFLTSIFYRFFSISKGFWEGFGRPKWSKNRDFGCFLRHAFGDLIFSRILLDF